MMAFPFHQQKNALPQLCDDDEFGEFTSAVSFSDVKATLHLGLPVAAQGPTFQPYTLQSSTQKIASNFVPNGDVYFNPIHDSEDEFGEFCGSIQIEQPSCTQNLVAKFVEPEMSKLVVVGGDQINNGVQNQTKSYKYQPNYNIDIDIDLVPTQLTWNTSNVSDDFGEFTSADMRSELEAENSLPVQVSQNLSDDSLLWNLQPVIKDSDAVSIVSLNLPSVLDTPSLLSDSIVNELSNNSDDEFGDFAQASLPSLRYEELKIEQSTTKELASPSQNSLGFDSTNLKILDSGSCQAYNHDIEQPLFTDIPQGANISLEDNKLDMADEEFLIHHINIPGSESFCDRTDSLLDADVDPLSSSKILDSQGLSGDLVTCDSAATKSNDEEEWSAFNEADPENRLTDEQADTELCRKKELIGDGSQLLGDGESSHSEDFTQFQAAGTGEASDDEFDEFEAAPPPAVQAESPNSEMGNSELKVQQLLHLVFPLDTASKSASESTPTKLLALCGSARGALWSYVKELESTPALSFQWKHSHAYQCLLGSLKIDSKQVNMLMVQKWSSTTSSPQVAIQPITRTSESIPESSSASAGLDLDFFLSQKNSSSHSLSQVSTTSENLLDTIEKELLSVGLTKSGLESTMKTAPTGLKSSVLSNSPNEVKATTVQQLTDLFDTLKCTPPAETSREKGLDLLQ